MLEINIIIPALLFLAEAKNPPTIHSRFNFARGLFKMTKSVERRKGGENERI